MAHFLLQGHVLDILRDWPDESFNCVVTSPPYWGLRDYKTEPQVWTGGWRGHLGGEPTPEMYVGHLVEIFHEVQRALRADGTLWLNLGDSYFSNTKRDKREDAQQRPRDAAGFHSGSGQRWHTGTWPVETGLKPKDLVGIPWRVAFALQADGWYLRRDIIWVKPNSMPESVTDRPTKSHEYIFMLSKSERYYYNAEAVAEPALNTPGGRLSGKTKHAKDWPKGSAAEGKGLDKGGMIETRNRRSVWTIATHPYKGAHFATFPPELARTCLLAGCPPDGIALDPFVGSGTSVMAAVQLGMDAVGIDLNPDYILMAGRRVESGK